VHIRYSVPTTNGMGGDITTTATYIMLEPVLVSMTLGEVGHATAHNNWSLVVNTRRSDKNRTTYNSWPTAVEPAGLAVFGRVIFSR